MTWAMAMGSMSTEGGYLIPNYLRVDKSGWKAWLWRWLGTLTRRTSIYERGQKLFPFRGEFLKVLQELRNQGTTLLIPPR